MENLAALQTSFAKTLRSSLRAVHTFPQDLVPASDGLVDLFIEQLDAAHELLLHPGSADAQAINRAYALNFYWVQSAKSFLLYIRDVIFEQNKAEVLTLERLANPEKRDVIRESAQNRLHEAAEELIRSFEEAGENLSSKELRHCKLQINPWPVYKTQFRKLSDQIHRVAEDTDSLLQFSLSTLQIRGELDKMMEECHWELLELKATIRDAGKFVQQIADSDPVKGPGKIAVRIPEYQGSIRERDYLKALENRLEELYKELPEKRDLSLGIQNGLLICEEIDVNRRIRQWLKTEILPLIYEVWELTDLRRRSAQLTLLNVRNWARILAEQSDEKAPEINYQEIHVLFDDLEVRTDQALQEMERLHQLADLRMAEQLRAHKIFIEHRPYLPVEVDSTINRLRKGQNQFLQAIVKSYNTQVKRVRRFLRRLEREESLSNSEKIVRRIHERTGDPENDQYTNIFLTKGFVGTSFTVGREEELSHAQQIVEDWERGYRGSILITGERYSGKSLLAELIATNFFSENTYRLEANSMITVAGRKFGTGYDLHAVLENIRKYKNSERCMLLVDDLESWWTDDIPIHESARKLARFANLHNNHFFLVVTMGNSLVAHLEQTVDIRKEFQSEMNMDKVPVQMIRDAILVRHGATHKKLLTDKGETLSPQQFRRISGAIASESRGNIGEALNLWANSTWKVDEEHVTNRFARGHDLPDFLESDLGILLAAILLHRDTSERQLRHIFGPAFSRRYAPVVRRLIGVGVLRREINGKLEINPVLVNRLGQILERQGYLKYLS